MMKLIYKSQLIGSIENAYLGGLAIHRDGAKKSNRHLKYTRNKTPFHFLAVILILLIAHQMLFFSECTPDIK